MSQDTEWKSIWERNDKEGRDVRYHLLWSKDGLGEDEVFEDLDALRASFVEECPKRLSEYMTPSEAATVPVVPEGKYQDYIDERWYDYDQCCWVNQEWAEGYYNLRVGAYYADLNGYARNITDKGSLGRIKVKFT